MSDHELLDSHVDRSVLGAMSASVVVAAESGLLEALGETPQSAEALAGPLSLDAFACARVLDLLVVSGLAEHGDEGYRLHPRHATGNEPVLGITRAIALWRHLPQYLRDGSGMDFTGRSPDREPAYAGAVDSLGRMFAPLARRLAQTGPQVPGDGRVLDVGAGSGIWSLAMARHDPRVRVTALDRPKVLSVFETAAARDGLRDRVAVHPGDYHEDTADLDRYDRALLANVLHLESEDDAAAMVTRFGRGLHDGGDLVIVDAIGGTSHRARLHTAAYALHLALRTGRGQVHPEPRLREWLASAGLTDITRVDLDGAGMGALVARQG